MLKLKIFLWSFGVFLAIPFIVFLALYGNVYSRKTKIWNIPPVAVDPVFKGDLALGERIVHVRNGCVDCHGEQLQGKVFLQDPAMGLFAGSNISSRKFQDWTDGEILRAIKHGINKKGESLYFMPSHEFSHLSMSDLVSVVGYLRSTPPISNDDIPIQPGPLFYILVGLKKIPFGLSAEAVDHHKASPIKPEEKPDEAFGRYLVESACVGCHGSTLEAGPIKGAPPDWPEARDIRGSKGLKEWTVESFKQTLRTGINPKKEALKPPMPIHLTAKMTDIELEAIWSYLSRQ